MFTGEQFRSGVVQVGFTVNRDGRTSAVAVLSSTNRRLNAAAVAAVAKWVFQPLEVAQAAEVAIEFKSD